MDLAINVINEVLKNNPNYTTHEQILNHILNRLGHDDELTELLNKGIELRLSQIELERKDILTTAHTEPNIYSSDGSLNDTGVINDIRALEARPYQLEYINQCSKLFQEGHDRCLMKSPTGSGKNLMIMSIIQKIISDEPVKPLIVICLSPRIDITKQITNPEYLAILQPYQFTPVIVHSDISYVKSNKEFLDARNENKHIIISGTYQSINRIMDIINQVSNTNIDFLIMDEAHYLAGQKPGDETAKDSVLNSIVFCDTRVKRRLFVTATPFEHQEIDCEHYGPLVNIVSVGQLIRLGYLAKLESSICRIAENKAGSASGGEFTDKAKGLYDFMTLNKRRKCIVFVNSKQNGYELQELITTRGYSEFKVVTYFGEDSSQVLEDFKTCTEPTVIITCKRINMGVDVPDVDSIVFADPRMSMWDISQCIGRGLRLVDNKVCHCLLYDNEEHNHMIMNYLNYVVNECEYEIVKQDVKQKPTNKQSQCRNSKNISSYNGIIDVRIDLLSKFHSNLNNSDNIEDELEGKILEDDSQVDNQNKYRCKYCEKSYKKFSSLKEHMYKTHISVNKNSSVSQSPEQLLDTDNTNNKAKIGRPKVYKCVTCNKTYSNKYSLERHVNGNICKKHISTTVDNSVLQSLTDVLLKLADSKQVNYTNSGIVLNGCSNVMMAEHIGNTENNNLYIREIHINSIGNESVHHLSDNDILRILGHGDNAVPMLAKAIMERPENCNIVETDKRNSKATIVNRDGDVEIMDLSKALTIYVNTIVTHINNYYDKFNDYLQEKNCVIQQIVNAHRIESDEDESAQAPKDKTTYSYFKKYMSQIKNIIDVNKKPIIGRINKYRDYKYKEKVNKQQSLQALTN